MSDQCHTQNDKWIGRARTCTEHANLFCPQRTRFQLLLIGDALDQPLSVHPRIIILGVELGAPFAHRDLRLEQRARVERASGHGCECGCGCRCICRGLLTPSSRLVGSKMVLALEPRQAAEHPSAVAPALAALGVLGVHQVEEEELARGGEERGAIDRTGAAAEILTKGRHDPCVGIRAVPVGEAMMACVVVDHALRHRAQMGDRSS